MAEHDSKPEGPLAASMERLRGEMEKWFEAVRASGTRAWETLRPKGQERRVVPMTDVVETPDDIRVFLDLPGVDPRTLEVNLTGNMLTVKGIKAPTPADEHATMHVDERTSGSFSRSVPLPAAVNPDQVSAETKDGVLTVVLMKSERAKPHQIRVNVSGSGEQVFVS
jgi:HSP20 family protein